ncbi:MAG: peptidase S8, partial [Nitrosopumilus sp.]
MPNVAIFFFVFFLFSFSIVISNSYASISGDFIEIDSASNNNPVIFDSDIIEIDSNFFTENNLKRYLIFGDNSKNLDFIKKNSINGIESDSGFFSISVLSKNAASNLAAQGYHVIEDVKLDFHLSNDTIQDASRIGEITGSSVANKKYGLSGNGTVIAIVDTGVDFSNPDIQHSLARDEINHPIMFDPDGQGIVLTNATFFAYIDENEIIRNYSKPIPS